MDCYATISVVLDEQQITSHNTVYCEQDIKLKAICSRCTQYISWELVLVYVSGACVPFQLLPHYCGGFRKTDVLCSLAVSVTSSFMFYFKEFYFYPS